MNIVWLSDVFASIVEYYLSFADIAKVIAVLWSEPAGPSSNGEGTVFTKYGESAYAEIRRFIVIVQKKYHSICV